jgi:hypothetical protein
MRFLKKDILNLLEQTLLEMPMTFPQTISVRRKNPNFDPSQEESDRNPKFIEIDEPFTERPEAGIQSKLASRDTPFKKVPMPRGTSNQNFQELLASETYKEVVRRVKQATGSNSRNLTGQMINAANEIDIFEKNHRKELEKLAVESVFEIYKIPKDSVNIYVKLVPFRSKIDTSDFLHRVDNENPESPDIDDETPEYIDTYDESTEIEKDYIDKLKNFDLERAKRRLINAMIQGSAHSAYNLYSFVANKIRNIVGSTYNGKDVMEIYALMMSINDSNYWQFSDNQIIGAQESIAGRVNVKFPKYSEDDEGQGGGSGSEKNKNKLSQRDTLGNPVDLSKPQVNVVGINFPVIFHEIMKGIEQVTAGFGSKFKGFDMDNRKHWDFVDMVTKYEDVMEYEMWDLRLGPAIWQRFRMANPSRVINPEEKIELQKFVQMNVYGLPARKFLALMKEIMEGTDRAKSIVSSLVTAIEQMLEEEDYKVALSEYNDEVDDIEDKISNDELADFLSDIPGIRLSDDDDNDDNYNDDDDDDDDFFK